MTLNQPVQKLGFGLMRLPRKGETYDMEQCQEMVDRFLAAGMTYFDTAYVYDDGDSERAVRTLLTERYPRDRFLLASKVAAWAGDATETSAKQQLQTSLERTGAGYFDFYLLHSMTANARKMYDQFGLWDFVQEQKAKGLIRNWGFSFHDSSELLDELLTAHPEADFVQLQINYADWEDPVIQSRRNYEIARKHGKPIVIMEPVKGGALASPPPAVQKALDIVDPNVSYASWALKFAASLDGVLTVLSGMSSLAQMKDNLTTMENFEPLDGLGQAAIRAAQEALKEVDCIHCTGCHYCTKGCPQHIPVPDIFTARNRQLIWNQPDRAKQAYKELEANGPTAKDCTGCGQCEQICPQHLPTVSLLQECTQYFGQ